MSYRLFGAETSAYSTKMRSYLAYKGVPFEWTPRTEASEDELRRVSRFGTLPVLVTASGFAVHDTTPLIEALEADSPEPSATPSDPVTAFLACVLEEYADVWLAKATYHYRWTRRKDQRLAAQRTIEEYYTAAPPDDRKSLEDRAIETMTGQLKALQLGGDLGGPIEKSFKKFVKLLDDHLRKHLFLFGERPSVADFAIAGQLIQMLKDPTPAKIIEKDGPFVVKWCEFMSAPTASGPFAALDDLRATLGPLFGDDLAQFFLPWAAENLESSLAGAETFDITLGKDKLTLTPLRSAARSFRELRRKFVSGQTIAALKTFTDETGATPFLLRPSRPDQRPAAIAPAVSADGVDRLAESLAASPEEAEAAYQTDPGTADEEAGRRRRRRRRRRGGSRTPGAEGAAAGSDASAEDVAAEPEAEDDRGFGDDAPTGLTDDTRAHPAED